tara:strand:- start:375 stop:551 length:177 start_codon:yes stop_codon:yes gene_type:complete
VYESLCGSLAATNATTPSARSLAASNPTTLSASIERAFPIATTPFSIASAANATTSVV